MSAIRKQKGKKGKFNTKFVVTGPGSHSFEKTVFNTFSFTAFLVAALLGLILYFIELKSIHVFLIILLAVIAFVLYYLSRFKDKTYPEAIILLLYVSLSVLWFTGVGSNGFAGLFFISGIMLSATLLKGVKRNMFFFLGPVIVTALVGIEYYHPEWVGVYKTPAEKYIDYLSNVILFLLAMGFFIKILIDNLRERGAQLEEANRGLVELAYYDQLTGVPNRRLFYENLDHTLDLARRNKQKFALLYLDLDNFKEINDKLGHAKGDIFLRNAAKRISGCLRKSDTMARMGGDEFIVVLHEIKRDEDVDIVARKIIDKMSEESDLKRHGIHVGVSIGISIFRNDNISADGLIKQADRAMYEAKELGKNRYHYMP